MRIATFGRLLLAAVLAGAALGQDNNGNGGNGSDNNGNTNNGNGNTGNGDNDNNGNANNGNANNGNGNNGSQQPSATGGNNNAQATGGGSSPSPTPTSGRQNTPTGSFTTITSVVANPNGQGSTTMVFTLTVPAGGNTSAPAPSAAPSNTTSNVNGTMNANGTDSTNTTAWNDTLGYLPFTPHLDAAYGLGGGLLILTGIPVATLGGKNRWSALAIISGYSVGLFSLIMILSFGVTPALQPPSPQPPSAAMRGLYLLAVGISFLIGSGLGIFFYTFAKYWVGAAGGFSFGWFLLALRKGGLVDSVGPRWAIIGGFTVAAILAALTPLLHEYMLLIASAWVGATAFTLGVDCFTRAGLKEFYMYNLGYRSAFPDLNGGKFPLTQNMQVELGVIAAAALIAGAIQFKLINTLQKRRKALAAKEAARLEAAEIDRAAEHFKNVDTELAEWEGKYGMSDSASNTITPTLGKTSMPTLRLATPTSGAGKSSMDSGSHPEVVPRPRPLSAAVADGAPRRKSLLEERLSLIELKDKDGEKDTPVTPIAPLDPELEQKLQLLAEVRRARQSIRSSMDHLRHSASTPLLEEEAESPLRSRQNSTSSSRMLDRGRYDSGASSLVLSTGPRRTGSSSSVPLLDEEKTNRRNSLGPRTLSEAEPLPEMRARPVSDQPVPVSEWDKYLQSRNILSPNSPPAQPAAPPVERFSVVSDSVGRAINQRGDTRAPGMIMPQPAHSPGHEYGANLARSLTAQELAAAAAFANSGRDRRASGPIAARRTSKAMTTEELAERHREKLLKMQQGVTGPMQEEQALAQAKEAWEARKRAEREEQRRRHESREHRGDTTRGASLIPPAAKEAAAARPADRKARTDEWRRSVAVAPKADPPSPVKAPVALHGKAATTGSGNSGNPAAPAANTTSSGTRPASPPPARRPTSPPGRRTSAIPATGASPVRPHAGGAAARPSAARRASRQTFTA